MLFFKKFLHYFFIENIEIIIEKQWSFFFLLFRQKAMGSNDEKLSLLSKKTSCSCKKHVIKNSDKQSLGKITRTQP